MITTAFLLIDPSANSAVIIKVSVLFMRAVSFTSIKRLFSKTDGDNTKF
jgi:hypothetical protein